MIVLKGRVIDGNGGMPIEKGAVILEDNKIRTVCRQADLPELPESAKVYEIEDGSILPGLIDAHVHMGWGSATATAGSKTAAEAAAATKLLENAQA